MKYICIKIKTILVAGVRARKILWHLVFLSNSKYCPNSRPEYIILPIPNAKNIMYLRKLNFHLHIY